ncbi:MAG TPA: 50S ribosomal protein L11 methyltransferase [Candidatus Acidoferrales bacterium]|nr:50S ribosomal protein L11 methyltransferase [Candidatus Acidoferrales bacterium]
MPSSWLQLSLRADPSALDAVANFLIERGSPGVVIKKNEVQAYFPHPGDSAVQRDVGRFLRGMHRIGPSAIVEGPRWRILKDRNWNSAWRRYFKPQRVGKSFWVSPPWIRPRLGRRHLVTIEPGMAFGTGTHATTRGCIEFLERVAGFFHGSAFVALDVGTGSGILAIALAKLGAKSVWAIDNDPVAVNVARENLHSNGVAEKVRLSTARLDSIRKSFSVVVANLTAETILDVARALQKKVAAKGFLVLSGILAGKESAVAARFRANGFRVLRRKREKEWITLLLRRK